MRSKVALTAFALVGSLNLIAAKCNKATTGLPASVTTPGGYTGTSTAGLSTITSGTLQPRGVQNLIRNGNFVGYDPSAPGGLYGYEVDGDGEARQVSGLGYTGDGSEENACAYLTVGQPKDSTTNGIDARDVIPDQSVSIKQELQSTDRESVYTMRVWYYVDMNEKANTCKLIATYDNGVLVESDYFPVVAANSGTFSWTALVQESPLISESGYLKFELRCSDGGSAAVRFDQVFFTNEVSLSDLDDITVIYSAFADASTVPPSLSSTTPIVASTTNSVTSSSAAQSPAASSPGTSVTVSDNGTTSGSLTGVASTTSEAGSNSATTTSSSAAASSTSFGDNICATLGSTSIAGRGCARRPYSGSSGYKQYTSDGTKEQCAALCLKDPRCLSFQWNTKSIGCVNGCYLLETSLADNSANNGGSDSNWAYDRSCIAQTQCPTTVPDNTVCVNVEGSTPGAGCTSNLNGQPRACASPFITTSVSPICGSSACRDVCHQYPSCKSFSYSVTGGQNCKLYSDTVSTVATSDGANYLTFFTDRSCNACGSGMAQFKNVATLADPTNMPVLTCPAPSSTAVVTSSSLSTSSTSSSVVSISDASTTLAASTTTAAPSATTTATSMDACPGGQSCTANLLVPANVYCKRAGQFNLDIGAWLPDSAKFPGKATSPEQCASICSQTKNCNSSSFSPSQGTCFLISETLAQGQFVPQDASSTSELWSDNACFTCSQCENTSSTPQLTTTTATPSVTPSATTTATSATGTCNSSVECKLKSYAPAGVYCKQSGDFNLDVAAWLPDSVKFPNKATSPEECAAICSQTSNCQSSSFSASRGICELMSGTLASGQFVPSASSSDGYVKSDNACFECTPCDASSSSAVLISSTTPTPATTISPSSTLPNTTSTPTFSTPTTFDTRTTPASSSTDQVSSSSTDPIITPYPQSTSTSTTPTTTTSAPAAAQTCAAPVASLSDDNTCGIPAVGGQQIQSTRLENYVIKPVGSLANCALECLARVDCLGFSYTKTDTSCRPYRVGTAGLGLTYTPTEATRFYDRSCFTCSA